ncbi:pyridoxine 5'-phosphate synthase [Methylobacterium nodulans]|uniref:Pyridoxine 5'-phosphate synthase n=1 Tax=Methylobacterium nodulans (strain LMG 21967 / CNCM I-2342 / ORS 2060) TaxID=460265 RepID=B8IMY7_METNO|nr:pyridoxine 5'-phosphate synthase [Methylobacterium nodulans]ACL62103.1 pyridoxal phosphate biosynthetic protein PdxJ [Methylobacterium nodulans ORS 2060]
MSASPLRLGVNIDHIATLRNARGGVMPDPLRAARIAVAAGADGITAHLREDRRHIRDEDVERLKREVDRPLNLEMAITDEMVAIAVRLKPHAACLVPERREERTTEGGLDIVTAREPVRAAVARLSAAGIRVSLFVEPDVHIMDAARGLEAPVVELHTGRYCEAVAAGHAEEAQRELARIARAAAHGTALGLEVHAGHGLTLDSVGPVAALPQLRELNIGHAIVAESVFVGFSEAVRAMRAAMDAARAGAAA